MSYKAYNLIFSLSNVINITTLIHEICVIFLNHIQFIVGRYHNLINQASLVLLDHLYSFNDTLCYNKNKFGQR